MGKLEIFWQAETFLVKSMLTCVLGCGWIKCQLICPMKYVVLYSHLILLTQKFWREPPQSEVSIRKGLQEAMVRHSTLLSSGGCNTCLNPSDRPRCCISAFIPWYLSYLFIPLADISRPHQLLLSSNKWSVQLILEPIYLEWSGPGFGSACIPWYPLIL